MPPYAILDPLRLDLGKESMSQKKILIVDDDKEVLKMLRIALEICCSNYQVESALNGSAALNLLRQANHAQPIDLILIDYNMPQMNGLELARLVRKTWPQTRIVLMSFDKAALEAGANSLSFDNYLEKPFTLRDLTKVLQPNQ
jgi:CheY-like chemotaxis protein